MDQIKNQSLMQFASLLVDFEAPLARVDEELNTSSYRAKGEVNIIKQEIEKSVHAAVESLLELATWQSITFKNNSGNLVHSQSLLGYFT